MTNQYTDSIAKPGSLHTDVIPENQPKGTHRYALNAIKKTDKGLITNEGGTFNTDSITTGFLPIGNCYLGNDISVIISVGVSNNKEQIGLLDRNGKYSIIVDTSVLSLKITNQCQIIYRLRGNQQVIYWVDGKNKARTFIVNKPYNFYTVAYTTYLNNGGNPNTYTLEKWDVSSFDLQKSYSSIPFFSNVEVLNNGSIVSGSYNFAPQYVDSDLNPTEWITTSNIVRIYNDTTSNSYHRIRGSRSSLYPTAEQNFPRANKQIKITFTNLDQEFPFYRVAIIRAAGSNGTPEKVYVSDLIPTSQSIFTYTGNDDELTETELNSILIEKEVIFAPKHIEQEENRLILANTEGKGINWCNFQKFASKISSQLVTQQIILNNINSDPNIKNPKSSFIYRGGLPGEVVSYGIAYLFNDGVVSPTYHIPGKNLANTTSKMKFWQGNQRYLSIHNCSDNNYWGEDSDGISLLGKKYRHHRFPFRQEVNKPLYTRTATPIDINQYSLGITITLNPAWVNGSTPNFFPVDSNNKPILITYTLQYKKSPSSTRDNYVGQFTNTDLSTLQNIYQDVSTLDSIGTGGTHYLLDIASQLFSYQDPTGSNYTNGQPRFIITETYGSTVLSTSINNDVSEIFGIEFSNIERPHPDVIGFYIMRNERTDDDRLIIDNVVMGPTTEYNNYKSFGLINPKKGSGSNIKYYNKAAWFFSPEHQFFGKNFDFTSIKVEGRYEESSVNMPTVAVGGKGGTGYGVYINDVQAGTSYNPDVNKSKDKDDDGFDLFAGYRNINYDFNGSSLYNFPLKDKVLYLNAASYQNNNSNTIYNASTDNKIGMYLSQGDIDTSIFYNEDTNKSNLVYASLTRDNDSAYSNFMTRPYYKQHNNPFIFDISNAGTTNPIFNGAKVFNGDSEISSLSFVSSVFYDMVVADRAKKSSIWKIVIGALLVVAAIVVEVVSVGSATPLAGLLLSYGVSLIASGIKFEQFKSMIETDYEKGLKQTVVDRGVLDTIRDTVARDDDTIRWFVDRANSLYIESAIPFGLRSGLTCGVPDFSDAPSQYDEDAFRSYITEKLTAIDRDQGSGRIYRGFSSSEIYDMNKDYMRYNKEKVFFHLSLEYDCCADGKDEVYPLRYWASQLSFTEEKVDNYRFFLPNNYKDLEGETGQITNIYKLGNSIFMSTREGLWQIPQSTQERITDEIVSFVGTGGIFALPAKRVGDDATGNMGTKHKWASVKTPYGVLIVSEPEKKIYLHGQGVKNIVDGNSRYFTNSMSQGLVEQLKLKLNIDYPLYNNPSNPNGIGYHAAFDKVYNRVLLTKRDYLIVQEKLDSLVLVTTMPTSNTVLPSTFSYYLNTATFYLGVDKLSLDNTGYFENKSWTMSYSFYDNSSWIGWHSYIPTHYIFNSNNIYQFNADNRLLRMNEKTVFQRFDNIVRPFIVEFITSSLQDKNLSNVMFHTKAFKWSVTDKSFIEERQSTFNKITAYNNSQSTGELTMIAEGSNLNSTSWFSNKVTNKSEQITIEKQGRNWLANQFRDYIVDHTKALFLNTWSAIKGQYPIDKVPNSTNIDFNMKWSEKALLEDKYIAIRLKFDGIDNIELSLNYSIQKEEISDR